MKKTIEEIISEVDEIVSNGDKLSEFKDSMINHCYINMINQKEREIYEESLLIFTEEQCVGTVLSILVMQYPKYGINTKEKIINEHYKLYTPFIIDDCMLWTIDKIIKLHNIENRDIKKIFI